MATHVKGSSALHNHFVIISVSFKDGKKYRWQKAVIDSCVEFRMSFAVSINYLSSRIQCPKKYRGRYGSQKSKARSPTHLFLKFGYSNKTNNPNASPSKRMFGLFSYGQYDRLFIGGISVRTERGAFSPSLCSYRGDSLLNLRHRRPK